MIYFDPDESKHITMLSTWRPLEQLEEWTGADFLITPLTLPAHSEILIGKHLRAGAFLVQRKKGMDLVNSISDTGNLWEMLSRMLTFCKEYAPETKVAQRIFLASGAYQLGKDNMTLFVNGKQAQYCTYWMFSGAIERIFERACVYREIAAGEETFYRWMLNKQNHTQDNLKHPTVTTAVKPAPMTEIVNDNGDGLQELIVVRDGRRTLVTFPGMGEQKANAVWEFSKYSLGRALTLITDPLLLKEPDRPNGIAKGLIQSWRAWLGLADDELIQITNNKEIKETANERRARNSKA